MPLEFIITFNQSLWATGTFDSWILLSVIALFFSLWNSNFTFFLVPKHAKLSPILDLCLPFPFARIPYPTPTKRLACSFLPSVSQPKRSLFREFSCPRLPVSHSAVLSIEPLCFILPLWHSNYFIWIIWYYFLFSYFFSYIFLSPQSSRRSDIFLLCTPLNYRI